MNRVYFDLPGVDESLRRQCTPHQLHATEPTLVSFVEGSLPLHLRSRLRLASAEQLRLAFAGDAELWSFRWLEENTDAPPIDGHVVRRGRHLHLIEFTDASFRSAFGHARLFERPADLLPFVRLVFRLSRRSRRRDMLIEDLEELALPDGIDPEVLDRIRANVPPRLESDGAGHRVLGLTCFRRQLYLSKLRASGGQLHEEPDRVPHEGHVEVRTSADRRLGREIPWVGQPDEDASLGQTRRRQESRPDEIAAFERVAEWRPEGFAGEASRVDREATEAHIRRGAAYGWEEVLPLQKPEHQPEIEALLRALNARCLDLRVPDAPRAEAGPDVREASIRIRRKRLPFYSEHRLYELISNEADQGRRSRTRSTQILFAPDPSILPPSLARNSRDLIPLDGASAPIHSLNDGYRPTLAGDTALEYTRFFCGSVSGDHGFFHPVEGPDDLHWRGLSEDQRELVAKRLRPLRLWPNEPGQPMTIDGFVAYGYVLWHAEFRLEPAGEILMPSERPVLSHLETIPNRMTAKTHFFLRAPRSRPQ